MQILNKYLAALLFVWTVSLFGPQAAHAHLMVAQHGTLNIVNDGAFMVLSLPISAFEGIDDDSDGRISMIEFNAHRAAVVASVRQNVTLSDEQGSYTLSDVMLSPVLPHDASKTYFSQLAVMGKFSLDETQGALRFHAGLYGKLPTEQVLEISAARSADSQKHVFKLTPSESAVALFTDDQ